MIGKTLAHYEILEKIGAGGMGEVYAARDTKLDRRVALKILPASMSCDTDLRARFAREVKAVAALNHPGIVTIYSVEESDGICFFAMEFVAGSGLGSIIPESGLPLERFLDLAIPLVDAVGAAHSGGIVHRDLKPDNVMITQDERVKILDFGLAKHCPTQNSVGSSTTASAPEPELTRDRIVGSTPYMSPEQIEGNAIDPRSDVFSLGIVLYEMITAARPFHANSRAALMASILRDPPIAFPESCSHCPPGLESILLRCLDKDPERRYANALELHADLVGLRESSSSLPGATLTSFTVKEILQRPAVAVLPFVNLGGNEEDEYLVDGIAEDIVTALSSWRWFPVIALNSTRPYRSKDVDVKQVGRELEASYILEGSVRKAGERVRISAHLLNTESGLQLWGDRYDRKLSDIFELQDEISARIVGSVEPELSRAEQQRALRKRPDSLDAWDCCLRAMTHLHQLTKKDTLEARRLLERAIELDPESSHAQSWLAVCHYEMAMSGWSEKPPEDFAESFQAARHAVELDDGNWMAHFMLGMGYLWTRRDYELGTEENHFAVTLNPSAPSAHHGLACLLDFSGRWAEAIPELHTILRLDPRYKYTSVVLSDLALSHLMLRGFNEAREFAEKSVRAFPHYVRAYQRLGSCLGHMDHLEAAAEIRRKLLERQPDFSMAYVESTYPFKNPDDREFFVEGLRKAGFLGAAPSGNPY